MTPKHYRVILEDDAIADLAAIGDHIAHRGAPDTATQFVNRLLDEIYTSLEFFPHGHQKREQSARFPLPMWRLPIDSYRVIYTILEEDRAVRVLHVQHGSRNSWP